MAGDVECLMAFFSVERAYRNLIYDSYAYSKRHGKHLCTVFYCNILKTGMNWGNRDRVRETPKKTMELFWQMG